MAISAKQFASLQEKTRQRRRKSSDEVGERSGSLQGTVILGIDPSLRGTGYGVIRIADPHPETLAEGTFRVPPTGNIRVVWFTSRLSCGR